MDFLVKAVEGKKTYLVVLALMVLNLLSPEAGLNLDTLKETLFISLGATFRSAVNKVGK